MEKFLKEWKRVYESDLQYVVSEIKEELDQPAVLFLEGKVGAGKTTFCRFFTDAQTLSPTYSILAETDSVLHADFYRLESSEEITHLELGLYLEGKDFFLAEWGYRYIHSLLSEVPESFQMYKLELIHDSTGDDGSDDCTQTRHLKLYHVNPLL